MNGRQYGRTRVTRQFLEQLFSPDEQIELIQLENDHKRGILELVWQSVNIQTPHTFKVAEGAEIPYTYVEKKQIIANMKALIKKLELEVESDD